MTHLCHSSFQNFSLHLTLMVLVVMLSQIKGTCLFKILNQMLKRLFQIFVFEAKRVSNKVCLLSVQLK